MGQRHYQTPRYSIASSGAYFTECIRDEMVALCREPYDARAHDAWTGNFHVADLSLFEPVARTGADDAGLLVTRGRRVRICRRHG